MNNHAQRIAVALWLAAGLVACLPQGALADSRQASDWSAWRKLPVYHHGRIMPLDTFATSAVETICGRGRPTLSLADYVRPEELKSPALAAARSLFPGDEPRKFADYELLLSWLVEPEKWEDVPFLTAEHDELLKTYFDLAPVNAKGEHVRFVSPRQVEESTALFARLEELADQQRRETAAGRTLKLSGVDKKIDELWQAFQLYRQLTFDPLLDNRAVNRFGRQLRLLAESWAPLEQELGLFAQADEPGGLGALVGAVRPNLEKLADRGSQARLTAAELEPPAVELAATSRQIAEQFGGLRQRLARQPPPQWDPDQVRKAQALMDRLALDTQQLADAADRLVPALYDNREWLRVVPALNPAALEKDRNPEDEAQPWLDLQTLLLGSEQALRQYPAAEVAAVRQAFARVKATYPERAARPNDFTADLGRLSAALRSLAVAVEPLRENLPLKGRDDDLIQYTRYPPLDGTANEVRYNTADPFLYSWIISLAALLVFGMVFVGMRRRMFWVGMAVLAAGLAWTIYGFYLRVSITGWAPVTNMYETVVYVPFFVTVLGAWFVVVPILWPGLKAAWRMTAAPFTWEAAPIEPDLADLFPAAWWPTRSRAPLGSWLLLAARVVLGGMVLKVLAWDSYAAGGRTIINLLPNIDPGRTLPDLNDALTWAVGLAVLVPTVWYLPRTILTVLVAVVSVPRALRARRGERLFDQVYARWPFALAATGVAFLGSFVAWYSPVLDESFTPLQPVLRDNFWLLIHVLTIVSSYGAGALALGLGQIALAYYLFGRYRPAVAAVAAGRGAAPGATAPAAPRRPPEACGPLAGHIYKAIQVAVVLLAAGTILGALWADVAWGRFWGWDPKEVWALISFLVYIAVLHGRFAGWVGDFGLTAGTVFGGTAIIMSWYGVNFVLGRGLHSYGFGDSQQGQWYVLAAVLLNWAFLGAAAVRYTIETDPWNRRPRAAGRAQAAAREEATV